jgi:glycosyltransferase involved in cell wall biosynthesis
MKSLYISYLGLADPLLDTQVVAYLRGLAEYGHTMHLLTYEPATVAAGDERAHHARLAASGVTWHWLRYHKRPSLPATAFDVARGVLAARSLVRRHGIDAVHARAHVPAAIGLALTRLTGVGLIFDTQGLMAEEYVDAGRWRADGLLARVTKAVERRALAGADAAVVHTFAARAQLAPLAPGTPFYEIPACVDLARFQCLSEAGSEARRELGIEDSVVMVYVGKFGGWYMHREMVEFFRSAREVIPNLHFLVVSQSDHALILREFRDLDMPSESYTVRSVSSSDVPRLLAAADFAISFIRAMPSKIASSPTKIGEYLAAGLPVVATAGLAASDALLQRGDVGIFVTTTSADGYRKAAAAVLDRLQDPGLAARARQVARDCLSLESVGIHRYSRLYEDVALRLRRRSDRPAAA